jgi:hypothetical protein
MARKKEFDLKEVERLAGIHEKQPAIMQALGIPALAPYLKSNEAFRHAYNRGRTKGGFALYKPRGGNSALADRKTAMAALDEDAREVLETIDTAGKAGISAGDVEINTSFSTLRVGRSLKILADNNLIHKRDTPAGVRFVAGAGSDPLPVPAKATTRGTKGRANASLAGDRVLPPPTTSVPDDSANGHSANGNANVAQALEMARVELLYQRVHGEPSTKLPDVIERVETELETLVMGAAA